MARVDFYVLAEAGEDARRRFACRLAEKAWRLDNTVHILAASREQAAELDTLLWTFRDGSFVPHETLGPAGGPSESPVTIAFAAAAGIRSDLLINLGDGIPEDAETFPRVAEIVTSDDDCRHRGRRLYAEYRSRGHSLESHELKG